MAGRIPEAQSRRLASQLVGTPGIDPSGQILAKGLVKASKQFQKQNEAQAQAEAKQDAFRKRALTDSRSAIGVVDFNNELDQLRRGSKNLEEYTEAAKKLLEDRVGGIEDDDERNAFSNDASRLLIAKNQKFAKEFRNQELDEIETNVNTAVDGIAGSVSDLFGDRLGPVPSTFDEKMDGFSLSIEMANEAIDQQTANFSPSELAKFRQDAATAFARAAINGLLDSSPEDVAAFLDEQVAGEEDILPPEEVEELRKYATDVAESRRKQAEAINKRLQNDTGTQWANRSAAGNPPTETEMQEALLKNQATEKDVRAVRNLKASKNKVFLGDNPQAYLRLAEEATNLISSLAKEAEDEDIEFVTMEALARFRQGVMEAMQEGTVSQSTGKKWLNAISPKFNEKLEETFKAINNKAISVGGWSLDMVSKVITDPVEIAEAGMRLQLDLMDRIDVAENKLGRRISLPEMSGLLKSVKSEFVHSVNPNRSIYAIGETIQSEGKLWVVYDFKENGDPRLSDFLDRPLRFETDDVLDEKGLTRPRPKKKKP